MGLLDNITKTIKNNDGTIFKKCPVCNRATILGGEKCCKECKNKILIDTKLMVDYINRLEYDIGKGFKKIEPYLTRYQIILENHKKVRENKPYIEDKIEQLIPEKYEDVEAIYFDRIRDIIREKKQVLAFQLEQTGEHKFYNEIKKLRDELLALQVKYPQFKDCLEVKDLLEFTSKK